MRVFELAVRRGEQRGDRLDDGLFVVRLLGERYRVRDAGEVVGQILAGGARVGPAGVDVELVVLPASDVRPAVVAALTDDVDLVVGVRAVLGTVERAVGSKVDALSIAVAVAVDVAHDAGQLGVVPGHGAVQVHSQDLADVGP